MKIFKHFDIALMFAFLIAVLAAGPACAQAGQTLDNQSLAKILTDMGLNPKPLSKGFLVVLTLNQTDINMQAVLSPNNSRLGLNVNFGVVDEASVTAEQWRTLLAANIDIDPIAFYYDPSQKKIFMHFSMENQDVTPATLRHYLDLMAQDVEDNMKLTTFTK